MLCERFYVRLYPRILEGIVTRSDIDRVGIFTDLDKGFNEITNSQLIVRGQPLGATPVDFIQALVSFYGHNIPRITAHDAAMRAI
tara:strand:- start:1051 stop:1305 length:255 start_codon:yes stop_codon:yes gene_type:complete